MCIVQGYGRVQYAYLQMPVIKRGELGDFVTSLFNQIGIPLRPASQRTTTLSPALIT